MLKKNVILKVENLSVSYNGKKAVEKISFPAAPGQMIGIIGPNGAGKSTLIKAIMGLVNIDEGKIQIMNQPVNKVCKKIAYVPQRNTIDFDFPLLVEDVVMMGRYPHLTWWGLPGARDHQVVRDSLKKVGMFEFRKKQIGQLSVGQQQRVFLARALAQEAELYFLDEPFSSVDVTSEKMIVEILKELRNGGKTIFVVHHDLSKVGNYFDSLILIKKKLIASGRKEEVFQINYLLEAYSSSISTINEQERMAIYR